MDYGVSFTAPLDVRSSAQHALDMQSGKLRVGGNAMLLKTARRNKLRLIGDGIRCKKEVGEHLGLWNECCAISGKCIGAQLLTVEKLQSRWLRLEMRTLRRKRSLILDVSIPGARLDVGIDDLSLLFVFSVPKGRVDIESCMVGVAPVQWIEEVVNREKACECVKRLIGVSDACSMESLFQTQSCIDFTGRETGEAGWIPNAQELMSMGQALSYTVDTSRVNCSASWCWGIWSWGHLGIESL